MSGSKDQKSGASGGSKDGEGGDRGGGDRGGGDQDRKKKPKAKSIV